MKVIQGLSTSEYATQIPNRKFCLWWVYRAGSGIPTFT